MGSNKEKKPCTKQIYRIKAKRLRATNIAIAKLELQYLYGEL